MQNDRQLNRVLKELIEDKALRKRYRGKYERAVLMFPDITRHIRAEPLEDEYGRSCVVPLDLAIFETPHYQGVVYHEDTNETYCYGAHRELERKLKVLYRTTIPGDDLKRLYQEYWHQNFDWTGRGWIPSRSPSLFDHDRNARVHFLAVAPTDHNEVNIDVTDSCGRIYKRFSAHLGLPQSRIREIDTCRS